MNKKLRKFTALMASAVMAVSVVPFAASVEAKAIDFASEGYDDGADCGWGMFGNYEVTGTEQTPYSRYHNSNTGVEFVMLKDENSQYPMPSAWRFLMGKLNHPNGLRVFGSDTLEALNISLVLNEDKSDVVQVIYTDVDGEVFKFENASQLEQAFLAKYGDLVIDPSEWDSILEEYGYKYNHDNYLKKCMEAEMDAKGITVSMEETATIEAEIDLRTGDVNMDGLVDLTDAVAVSKYLSKSVVLTETQMQNADTTADGVVDEMDVSALVNFVVMRISHLPYTGEDLGMDGISGNVTLG